MTKIGYVDARRSTLDARCPACGETYNGYAFHSCAPSMELAQEKVLRAAEDWVAQFLECPLVRVDANLYQAALEYARSRKAEPTRKSFKAAFAEACLPKPKPKPKRKKR